MHQGSGQRTRSHAAPGAWIVGRRSCRVGSAPARIGGPEGLPHLRTRASSPKATGLSDGARYIREYQQTRPLAKRPQLIGLGIHGRTIASPAGQGQVYIRSCRAGACSTLRGRLPSREVTGVVAAVARWGFRCGESGRVAGAAGACGPGRRADIAASTTMRWSAYSGGWLSRAARRLHRPDGRPGSRSRVPALAKAAGCSGICPGSRPGRPA